MTVAHAPIDIGYTACHAMQKEVVQLERDHSTLLDERNSTIQDMEKKVKTSQQFLDQKDSMDSALQQLQQTLEQERKQHQQQIGSDISPGAACAVSSQCPMGQQKLCGSSCIRPYH